MSLPHREAPLDDFTVSGPSLLSLLHFAASQGAVVTGILEAHGLDARGLASPDVRVVQAVNDAVWSEVGRRLATPDFGLHYAQAFSLDHMPVLGHLAAHSATVRQALDRSSGTPASCTTPGAWSGRCMASTCASTPAAEDCRTHRRGPSPSSRPPWCPPSSAA